MAYTPYEWTVNSYLNPTRMNAIEQGIAAASQAAESASGEFHTIEELIGTQSIAGIGDGTLTGATWKINNDLTELSGVVTTLNSKLSGLIKKRTVTGTPSSSGAFAQASFGNVVYLNVEVTSHQGKIALRRSGGYIHVYTPNPATLEPFTANETVSADVYYIEL